MTKIERFVHASFLWIFFLFSLNLSASMFSDNPEDPLFGYILTDDHESALEEIKVRLSKSKIASSEKDELLLLKTSTHLKLKDPMSANDALLLVEDKMSEEYYYKNWIVNWELLKATPKDSKQFQDRIKLANLSLEKTLFNPAFFNADIVSKAEEYLEKFPNSELSQKMSTVLSNVKSQSGKDHGESSHP